MKLKENVKDLAIKVFEQKEATDHLKLSSRKARIHDICENGRNHFLTKARLHTISEMSVNPADRELFARLYSRVDQKIWNISETRAWYDNVWQSEEAPDHRSASAAPLGLTLSLPSYDLKADRQRPTRAHTARVGLGRRHQQVSTHFREAWPDRGAPLQIRSFNHPLPAAPAPPQEG